MTDDSGPLLICCLLWAYEGEAEGLARYEDRVVGFLVDHGATLLERVRGDGSQGHPHEVQLYRFPDEAHMQSFIDDDRRVALAAERDRVIARTEVFPVTRSS